jgi:hypothetical protein
MLLMSEFVAAKCVVFFVKFLHSYLNHRSRTTFNIIAHIEQNVRRQGNENSVLIEGTQKGR